MGVNTDTCEPLATTFTASLTTISARCTSLTLVLWS